MATPVQISVVLDESGAVKGFLNIGTAAEGAEGKLLSAAEAATVALNNQTSSTLKGAEAVAVLQAKWEAEQASIAAVNARIKENMAAWTASTTAATSATSAFQGITSAQTQASISGRLLESQLGLSNRALNQVMARSQLLGPVMQAMFPLAIFSAVVPMFEKIAEEVISVTNDMGGYTAAVQQVQRETVQASQAAFLNPKTLAFAQQHLATLNSEIEVLNKASSIETSRGQMISDQVTLEGKIVALLGAGYINSSASASLSAKATAMTADRIALLEKVKTLEGEINDAISKGQESNALIGKSGFAKIAQEHANTLQDISDLGAAGIDPAKAAALRVNADNKANAEIAELHRQMAMETMQLNDQVTENSLQGIAKIKQAEQDHINEETIALAKRLGMNETEVQQTSLYQAKIAQIHQETTQKVIEFQRQQQQATQQLQNEATLSGLDGDAKIIESANQRADKERDLYSRGVIDYDNYAARIEAIDKIRNNQIQANDEATTQKNQAELDKRTQAMEKAAGDQKDALQAAALATVPTWQKAYAQIEVESQKRLQQIQDEESKALLQYKDDAAARVQIEATADAKRAQVYAETNEKIQAENQRMTEQLGSDLQSVFDDITSGNIGKRILANMEKLFFQIVAQWILSLGTMKSAFGSLFGSLVFGPQSTGANVFGGGTSFLSSFLGTSSSNLVPAGSSGFAPAITGFSSTAGLSLPGLTAGGGLAGAIAGTGSTPTFSASNALTSQSFAQISNSTGVFQTSGGPVPLFGSTNGNSSGLFGSLFSARGLAALAPIGAMALGASGGAAGQAGGLLMGLLLSGKLGSLIQPLTLGTGLAGTIGASSLVGGGIGGLLGFGIGSQHGGLLGSLVGAGSGALTGFMVGGPVGAVVGGIIGLLGGIFGGIFGSGKRKRQADAYAQSTVIPDIKQITSQFDTFQLDSSSAMQQLEALRTSAQQQLAALKSQGKDVFNNTVTPAIDDAEKHVQGTETERERRAAIVFGAPQFHDGGVVDVMRASVRRQPDEMLAWLKHGEAVLTPAQQRGIANSKSSGGGGGNHYHFHLNAMDAKSFDQWARQGGAQMMTRALDRYLTQEGN